ncbi:Hemicentin-1 [Nymphon striatum]|nr:Hemicentin-1 [Nymphon striatum]
MAADDDDETHMGLWQVGGRVYPTESSASLLELRHGGRFVFHNVKKIWSGDNETYDAPELSVKFGTNRFSKVISEFHDVYLTCEWKANPKVNKVSWYFEGEKLETNHTAKIIVSDTNLVLQTVTRRQKGGYTCSAKNSQGTGTSQVFSLRIRYPPVCKEQSKTHYAATLHETINVVCEVDADPTEVNFEWTFNNSIETISVVGFTSDKTTSIAKYTPRSQRGFGILSCSGSNAAGQQVKPCQFRITFAGPPDSLYNCSIVNQTFDAIHVLCFEGYHGGLQQMFYMEVYDKQFRSLQSNISNFEQPSFVARGLSSNRQYSLHVYAANAKGRSPAGKHRGLNFRTCSNANRYV